MLTRIFAAAVFAGMLGGLAVTAMQMMQVVPLILKAESYESAASVSLGHDHGHEHAQPHDHDAANDNAAGSPDDDPLAAFGGSDRTLITLLVNLVMATGFALLLCAAFALRGDGDARKGLLWGAAGFLVFNLAPALGLPPELPGAYAAPLFERQTWWLGTIIATGSGLGLITLRREHLARIAGLALLVTPHLIGAPQPETHGGNVPIELAHQFLIATLVTAGLFWLLLGALAGYFFKRLDPQS
ncbi:MAG: cobalt transporter [Rhodospirillaceae bacterium]|nr:cobalt transporter [Rhodospirillaceae bacterium]MBT5373037.1 cobalt transporter [Rhodospirillaceae bacterium]MBT5659939.1 cobalt transporter [Rhodospirillaceae bacterium]MBT5751829.1 cobalt transporter [Rhodospirillaceae bacterium]